MRKCMKRLLSAHGFNAMLFEFGFRAAPSWRISVAPFASSLTSICMDQSGIELRRQLVDKGVRLPVIFITGNDSDANRSAAMASGCIAYLTKPFSAPSLIEAVERAHAASILARTVSSFIDVLFEGL